MGPDHFEEGGGGVWRFPSIRSLDGEIGGATVGPYFGEDKRRRTTKCAGDRDRRGLLLPFSLVGD